MFSSYDLNNFHKMTQNYEGGTIPKVAAYSSQAVLENPLIHVSGL